MSTIWSFGQTWCSWPWSIPSSSSKVWDLVERDSNYIEDHVIDDECNPWPYGNETENELYKISMNSSLIVRIVSTYEEAYKPCFDERETCWKDRKPRHCADAA
jgi:hypothetical protein